MFESIILLTLLIFVMYILSQKWAYVGLGEKRVNHSGYYFLMLLIFSLFFGVRDDFGNDYETYLAWYEGGRYFNDERTEILFRIISNIGYNIALPSYLYFSLFVLIQISFFLIIFKEDRRVVPFVFLFLITSTYTGYGINFWMNGIRQACAMCIWVGAVNFINQRKLIPYLCLCALAVGFHTSAIILVLCYPLMYKGKDFFSNEKIQLILFISVFLIKPFFSQIVQNAESLVSAYITMSGGEIYEGYDLSNMLEEVGSKSGRGIFVMLQAFVHSMIILNSKSMKAHYGTERFINIYNLYFFGLLTTFIFPEGVVMLSRPFRYFGIFQVIMLAYFIRYLKDNKAIRYGKTFSSMFMGLFYLMFVVSQISASPTSHMWYKTIFDR